MKKNQKNSSESAEGDQESPKVASRQSLSATRPFNFYGLFFGDFGGILSLIRGSFFRHPQSFPQ